MTRTQRIQYALLLVLAVGALAAFLGWWLLPSHVPSNFTGRHHVLDWVLFVALTLVFGHRLFMDAFSWVVAWGMRDHAPPGPPEPGLRVAFITTFVPSSEPIELLHRTLPAMVAADYPHDTWLLDEGDVEEVRLVCEQYGVKYFSRSGIRRYNLVAGPFTAKTKGGNHNAWYDTVGGDYDVVAQIDTDFLPRRDFLTSTLGHFRDPEVGFVGTPQVYGNAEQSFVARGASQQQYMFYGPMLRGLASRGHANMIGANHVVRVAALRDVGLYAGHLTEDLLTGMRLHANGWESRYVPQPLAVGEGPSTWQAYFNQQTRWAFGCMDILRWHSPSLFRSMRRRQAGLYLALQQHYFTGLAAALGVLLLVTYFAAGLAPAHVGLREMLLWVTPLVVTRQLVSLWLQRFNPDPDNDRGWHLAGRYTAVVTWPIYLLATIGVLRQKRLVFKVTPKGKDQVDRTPLSMIAPHMVITVVAALCLASAVVTHRLSIPMVFWASCTGVLMLSFVVLVLATRTPSSSPARVATIGSSSVLRQPAQPTFGLTGSRVLVHADVVDDHLLRPRRES
jgi:cellulose synthase/poly-beta-1,6-N-acetylglucosamine synthase-like glycosyltransferase